MRSAEVGTALEVLLQGNGEGYPQMTGSSNLRPPFPILVTHCAALCHLLKRRLKQHPADKIQMAWLAIAQVSCSWCRFESKGNLRKQHCTLAVWSSFVFGRAKAYPPWVAFFCFAGPPKISGSLHLGEQTQPAEIRDPQERNNGKLASRDLSRLL